jgi:Glutaminase
MHYQLLLALLVFGMSFTSGQAASVFTTVFNVFESSVTNRILVLSGSDGRIFKINKSEENLALMNSLKGKVVHIEFSEQGQEANIQSIREVHPNEIDLKTYDLNRFMYNKLRMFAPTDLQDLSQATYVFDSLLNDGDRSRTQCFKRAHIWAFDMWSKLGIDSQKIFVFYTKRYAILEEFDWWFHVAPTVKVGEKLYVMDATFMSKPVTVKEWLNYFLRTDQITCPQITKYQDFEDHQWNRLCYHMIVPMYYFRPSDIEQRDKANQLRNHWEIDELQDARRAFRGWEETYEGLDTGKQTRKF